MRLIPKTVNSYIFLVVITVLMQSCYHLPYSKGDRFFQKKKYEIAISHYKNSLKNKNIKEDDSWVINFKISKCQYFLGNRAEALRALRNIISIKPEFECELIDFKMRLINEEKSYDDPSELASLFEKSEAISCPINDETLNSFFNGLREKYYRSFIRKGDRFFIMGQLKLRTGDYFSALDYFSKALRTNPGDEEYLLNLSSVFIEIEKNAQNFSRKQKLNFFKTNYVDFFSFISAIATRTQGKALESKAVSAKILELTNSFKEARSTRPVSLYSHANYQERKNLLRTFQVNEPLRIFRIDQGDKSSNYIVFSPKKRLFGFTSKLDSNSFILSE